MEPHKNHEVTINQKNSQKIFKNGSGWMGGERLPLLVHGLRLEDGGEGKREGMYTHKTRRG